MCLLVTERRNIMLTANIVASIIVSELQILKMSWHLQPRHDIMMDQINKLVTPSDKQLSINSSFGKVNTDSYPYTYDTRKKLCKSVADHIIDIRPPHNMNKTFFSIRSMIWMCVINILSLTSTMFNCTSNSISLGSFAPGSITYVWR